ncbi:hypothetical protein BC941DRAFT_425716 [Chlamydoabsidia padenii]|nr:hypothetical protein BC941DRAFT_425716 [Chlamydoabsidia padenii]
MEFSDDLDNYLNATRNRLKPKSNSPTNNIKNNGEIATHTITELPDHERYFYNSERDMWYDMMTDTYSKYDAKRQLYIPVSFDYSLNDTAPTDKDDDVEEPDTDATLRLVVLSSTVVPVGQVVLTDANGMTLGRDKHDWDTRTTRLRDMQVSKIHCHLFYDHDRHTFAVTDMGSQNGTLLNGERLSPAKQCSRPFDLAHGDELTLGVTVFQVHLHDQGWPCQQCQTSAINTSSPAISAAPATTTTTTTTTKKHTVSTLKKNTTKREWQKRLLKEYEDDTEQQQQQHYIDRARLRRERVSEGYQQQDDSNRPAEVIDLHTPVQGKGYDMLKKMGWQNGQGVGLSQQGITVPLAPTTTPYVRAGLGVSTSKKERLYHQMKQRYEQP